MEPKELRNYGIAFSDLSANPPKKAELKVQMKFMKLLFKNIGFFNFMRFFLSFPAIIKKMQKQDFSKLREKGLNDENFIKSQIDLAAMYSCLSEIIGQEKTIEILKELMVLVGSETFTAIFPLQEDLFKCKDPFEALKEWFLASIDADKKAGCHLYEIVENSNSAFQMNCIYCAWYEIAKLLGSDKVDLCYADDVFFADYLKPLKIKFIRTNTLLRGGPFCDFRYERE